jgi:hypothetical protein
MTSKQPRKVLCLLCFAQHNDLGLVVHDKDLDFLDMNVGNFDNAED